jgi:phosphatidylserine/phosphatidylglycerophosphate/cardiolipin synthase-like enzyme
LKRLILILVLLLTVGCSYAEGATDYSYNTINVNQTTVLFTRAGQYASPVLVDLYNKADKNIDVAIYALTDPYIINALKAAAVRGIKVRVITDRRESQDRYQHIALDDLLFTHIPVKINSHADSMHLKMSVIDGKIVTTGSYNYTLAANQTNDEMFVIITEPNFVRKCQDEFDRLWESDKGIVNYPQ